jgi:hypothetical protein
MNVASIADLAKLRHKVGRLDHHDETLSDQVVTLLRSGWTVARILCSTSALAFDALRICAGIRLRREDGPALDALPLLLAA